MLYFTIELFIDALILVLHSKSINVITTVEKMISIYQEETKDSTYMENELFDFYINLIKEIIRLNITVENKTEIEAFILKFRSSPLMIKSPDLFTTLKNVFTDANPIEPDKIKYMLRKINNCLLWYDNSKQVKKMFGILANVPTSSTPEKQEEILGKITTLCSEIMEINTKAEDQEDTDTRIYKLDMSNLEQITKAVKAHTTIAVTGVLKTGLQALNRSLGTRRGFALGETISYNALSHCYKSTILEDTGRWIVQYNTPPPGYKNPLVFHVSLENEISYTLHNLFKRLWINQYKALPPENITEDQIINYCYDYFRQLGWFLIMERRLGADFGFPQFVSIFEEYKAQGYTPVACIIDYLNIMSKNENHTQFGNHLLIRELYNNICNYLKSQGCCFFTGHQLSRHATEIIRNNPMNPVKRFTIDCLADGMDPQREIDVAYYMHIEKNQLGEPFLTMKIDKHRYVEDTPEIDKFFAYKFEGPLGILDDVNGNDASYQNIYAVLEEDESRNDTNILTPELDIPIPTEVVVAPVSHEILTEQNNHEENKQSTQEITPIDQSILSAFSIPTADELEEDI